MIRRGFCELPTRPPRRPGTCLRCLTWALILGVLTTAALPPASAQEPVTVTHASATREASNKAPDVLAALIRARATRDSGPTSFATPNPRLTVGSTEYAARETVSFYAFLPFFGRRQAGVATTEALADVADVDVEVARLDARLAVSLAWIDLWLAQGTAEIADSSRVRRDRLLELATERFDAGSAPRLDQIRARADALKQRAEVDALVLLQRAASARLSFLLGRAPEALVLTDGTPSMRDQPTNLASLRSKLESHPVYLAARASLKADTVAVDAQRRQLLPFLGVQAGAAFNPRNGGPNDYNGAVLVEFPVYGVPALKRARAAQRAAEENAALILRRLEVALVEAQAHVEAASRRAHSAREEVMPAAHEMSDLALEAYHEGSIDLTGALTTEQAYFDATLAAIQGDAELARASAHLSHAIGEQL